MSIASTMSSIRARIILIVTIVGLAVAGAFFAVNLTIGRQALKDEIFATLKLNAHTSYKYIHEWLNARMIDTKNFAANEDNKTGFWLFLEGRGDETAACGRHTFHDHLELNFEHVFKSSPYYTFAFLLDTKGTIVIGTHDELVGEDFSHREYFKEGMKGAFLSDVFLSEVAGKLKGVGRAIPIMIASAPIVFRGETLGVVAFTIDMEAVNKELIGNAMGESGEVYLVSKNGVMLSESRFKNDMNASTLKKMESLTLEMKTPEGKLTEGVKRMLETKKAGNMEDAYPDYRGVPVYGFWNWLSTGHMGVMAEIDEAEANKAIVRQTIIQGIAAVVLLVLAVIAGIVFANSIARLLLDFEALLLRSATGDLTAEYPMPQFKCSEEMNCGKTDCPSYDDPDHLCFIDAGSFAPDFGKKVSCPKILNGVYKTCEQCSVFTKKSRNEIERLAAWYNAMLHNLREIVAGVMGAATNISDASREIATGNQDLSSRTEEQAASLEETASSMEEMASTIRQTAENASTANTMVKETQSATQAGVDAVTRTVTHMGEISEASSKISEITKVIENIAFQTNILALNAAVEAARAGEMGKGFAVVASEVRSLAQTTSQSVKDIAVLIQDSVEKIDNGSKEANNSGEILATMQEKVNSVVMLMDEIAAASHEQQKGVEQVNTAVTDMDTVTQQNAALVEEAASSSEEMSSQAEELVNLMQFFKLTKEDAKKSQSSKQVTRKSESSPKQIGHAPAKKERYEPRAHNNEKEEFEEF